MNNKIFNSAVGSLGYQELTCAQVKETPLTRLALSLERLRKAEAFVSSVSGKLVGERGEGTCGDAPRNGTPGMFGEIERIAEDIADLADRIETSASRISDRL